MVRVQKLTSFDCGDTISDEPGISRTFDVEQTLSLRDEFVVLVFFVDVVSRGGSAEPNRSRGSSIST